MDRWTKRVRVNDPATGSPVIHAAETKALISEALGLTKKSAWDKEPDPRPVIGTSMD